MPRPHFSLAMLVLLLSMLICASPTHAEDKNEIKVKVLSGNNDLKIARQTADRLVDLGYDVDRVDLASRSDFTASYIYYAKNLKEVALTMASELSILKSNIRPLSWVSVYDIIVVTTAAPPLPEPDIPPPEPEAEPTRPKPDSGQIARYRQTEENINFAVAEAHALFVNREYEHALNKYRAVKIILTRARQLCPSVAESSNAEKLFNIKVLTKSTALNTANTYFQMLAKAGYPVLAAEFSPRKDLSENTLYYKPEFKNTASDIAHEFDNEPALVPMQWLSSHGMILVVPGTGSEAQQPPEVDEKIRKLHQRELYLKETIDLLTHEAFNLLCAGSSCRTVLQKFDSISTHIEKVEAVCQAVTQFEPPTAGAENPTLSDPDQTGIYPETTVVINLDEAIATAIAANPQIGETSENILSARAQKKSAFSDFLPKADFSYSYTRLNEAPIIATPIGDFAVGSENNFSWDLTLSQPLFTGFGLVSQFELKKLNLKKTEFEKTSALQTLVRDVRKAYYDLLLARKMELVTQDTVTNLKSHAADAQQFFNQGMIPYNDLLKAQVALANAAQENEKTRSMTKMAVAQLNMLLNFDINQKTGVVEVPPHFPAHFQITELLHGASENRPELAILHLAIKSADQAIRAAKSAYYPQVALVGKYGQTGQDVFATENDYGEVDSASLTLQASVSLYNGGKTGHELSRLAAEKRALVKQYEGAENRIRLQVKNVFENLKVSEKNIKTAQAAVSQAMENWRITDLQYQEQIATSTDVLDARTFLSQAQLNYYQAHYGYMKALADLDQAVGKPFGNAADEPNVAYP